MDILPHMIAGLSSEWLSILFGGNRKELCTTALVELLRRISTGEQITPEADKIFAAFRLCATPRVVILGQDPYPGEGVANGLSFGVAPGAAIPPSLRNIYACLLGKGLIESIPPNGDLSPLAAEGVLLLNCALTTTMGKSDAHASIWSEYTDALIEEISRRYTCAFILLGKNAQKKAQFVGGSSVTFQWGHPSPLNSVNKQPANPLNFRNCDAFTRANEFLRESSLDPINYGVLCGPSCTVDPGTIYIFTDGGSTGNGKEHATARWAFYVVCGTLTASDSGEVPPVDIPGKIYKSSNNRGELSGILRGLQYISGPNPFPESAPIHIISDSDYSIKCVTLWINSWRVDPEKKKGKKNLDLIDPAADILTKLRVNRSVRFTHMRSHQDEPKKKDSPEWFFWKGNDTADKLCAKNE